MERRTVLVVIASAAIVAGFLAIFLRDDRPTEVYLFTYGALAVAFVLLGVFGQRPRVAGVRCDLRPRLRPLAVALVDPPA
jgi:hypothetical protein